MNLTTLLFVTVGSFVGSLLTGIPAIKKYLDKKENSFFKTMHRGGVEAWLNTNGKL